jgi:hypothetical protein
MKDKMIKRKHRKRSDIPVAAMKGRITDTFAQQVAGFIRRYRSTLEALAKH